MLELRLLAGLALVVAGLLGWRAIENRLEQAGAERERAKWTAQAEKDRQAIEQQNLLANRRAIRYEEEKATRRERVVVVTKEVTRAIDAAPAWRDAALPDGVRGALAAAAATAAAPAASEPAGDVRGAGAAGAEDERGPRGGFPVGARGLAGLSGPASGPR
jgi:hypothetical protein